MQDFHLSGLKYASFAHLFDWTDAQLAAIGARRVIADHHPGFPCRVSLTDAPPGAPMLLLTFEHQRAPTPYRASGPIYVARDAIESCLAVNEIPDSVARRWLSLRGYDQHGELFAAEVCAGSLVAAEIERLFADAQLAYLHLHNARHGCYLGRVDRVTAPDSAIQGDAARTKQDSPCSHN